MKNHYKISILLMPIAVLGACSTTKVVAPEVIIVTPPPIEQTCISINTLTRVVIPAETKSGFSIVSIENPDEQYFDPKTQKWVIIEVAPIERREPWSKVIKPEEIFYINAENKEVTDICEPNDATPKVAITEDSAAVGADTGTADTGTVGAEGSITNPAPSGQVEETDLTDIIPH